MVHRGLLTPPQTAKFTFSGHLSELPAYLREKFILNTIDDEMRQFLDGCEPTTLRFFKHWCGAASSQRVESQIKL